jgi:hypothetical protein
MYPLGVPCLTSLFQVGLKPVVCLGLVLKDTDANRDLRLRRTVTENESEEKAASIIFIHLFYFVTVLKFHLDALEYAREDGSDCAGSSPQRIILTCQDS